MRPTVGRRFLISGCVKEFEATHAELITQPRAQLGWSGPWTSSVIYARWAAGALRRRLARSELPAAPDGLPRKEAS